MFGLFLDNKWIGISAIFFFFFGGGEKGERLRHVADNRVHLRQYYAYLARRYLSGKHKRLCDRLRYLLKSVVRCVSLIDKILKRVRHIRRFIRNRVISVTNRVI